MFVKDDTKVSGSVGGVEWRVVYFGKLVFESDEVEFSNGDKIVCTLSNGDYWAYLMTCGGR